MLNASKTDIYVPSSSEILRLAYVASAAFYLSPVNAYERPNRDSYPNDTMASYANELSQYLFGSNTALLAIHDAQDSSENEHVYSALRQHMEQRGFLGKKSLAADEKVAVGFMCLTFQAGSGKHGFSHNEKAVPLTGRISESAAEMIRRPEDGGFLDHERDKNIEGVNRLSVSLTPPIDKHLGGLFTVSMIAVHPAYQRRGHGTALLQEAARLADADQIPMGIAAVRMGVENCERAGFQQREVVKIEGYSEHPESFEVWIGIREPRRLVSSKS